MMTTRRDWLKGLVATIGLDAVGGGRFLFAAPPGWTAPGGAKLVLGVFSDTHLRTDWTGLKAARTFPHDYLNAALEYFRAANVDAVIHCGDMAHRGQVRELEFHAEAWRRFFPDNRAPDGHMVEKLFVTGNHETDGGRYGTDDGFKVEKAFPDPAERDRHVLAVDLAAKWEKVWGEKYEPVWHKEIKGYHFFGRHHGVGEMELAKLVKRTNRAAGLEKGTKPFFLLSHVRPHAKLNRTMGKYRNAISLFGHWHRSASNWNVIHMWSGHPAIQIPACLPRGKLPLCEDAYISRAKLEQGESQFAGVARQGLVIRIYDDMMAIERREFGAGGSLGADWILPLGKYEPHPFSREELQKVIGSPQFRDGVELEIVSRRVAENAEMQSTPQNSLCVIKIPRADGNPNCRAYAYEVEVKGDEAAPSLLKATYAAGINMGIGHETNGGVTELSFPAVELPGGGKLEISVTPLSSLGTRGAPLTLATLRNNKDETKS